MVSLSFNILLLLVIALMLIASAGGIGKMPVKQEHMIDDNSVTGDAAFDSMKTSHMNAQVDSQMLKKNERNSPDINQFPEQNHERSKKEESKEFVDADNEVANLMSKDYSGRNRPRRVAPIHN